MDVKEAVQLAKSRIVELFGDEGVTNVGLEEIEHDDLKDEWQVTIGFSRPWDKPTNALAAIGQEIGVRSRSYKVVRIDDHGGKVISVKNRELIKP
jgi:hypothetical protein